MTNIEHPLLSLVACAAVLLPAGVALGDIVLPHVIGNNMVLQRQIEMPIWGWAAAGETVTVQLGPNAAKATADATGAWMVRLPAMEAGGPYEMTVSGRNTIKLTNILVGEVWLCSGQSNMRWPLNAASDGKEAVAGAELPKMRLFQVPLRSAGQPVADVNASWAPCQPATAARFSAVGFHFGRMLHKELKVPVGLIDAGWSGSRIEPWVPPQGFASVREFPDLTGDITQVRRDYVETFDRELATLEAWARGARAALADGRPLPLQPAAWPLDEKAMNYQIQLTAGRATEIYNGMIHPLVPFGIRGAIWYQGESNVTAWPLIHYSIPDGGLTYALKMKALVQGWRAVWGEGDFPFYYVQIAPCKGYPPGAVPEFWEAQTAAMSIKNTGMAVTTDIGVLDNIHPPNKRDVGKRLALWALAKTYGRADVVCSGPQYKSLAGEGNKARLAFEHVGGGLASRDGKPLTWFTVAGEDRKFVAARAEIAGDAVVVWSDAVATPAAVRFAWDNEAMPNLMNKEGLPTIPFRTDAWEKPVPKATGTPAENARRAADLLAENAKRPGVVTTASGLQYLVLKAGDGPTPTRQNQIKVHYTLTRLDGAKVESSYDQNEPATPPPYATVPGLREALTAMKVGSKWRVFVPPALAYGERGNGPAIGPNTLLIYEIELLAILR